MNLKAVFHYTVFAVLFAGVALWLSQGAVTPTVTEADAVAEQTKEPITVLIDAGHGGEDGGAVSEDGTVLEKDLNLAIAEKCADVCTVLGIPWEMTRSDDRMLYDHYDDLDDYTGRRKTYDLRNRLRLAEEKKPRLFLGIHQNKYPDASCRGLQVYYSPNSTESENAAALLRAYSNRFLDPTNQRETKAAGKSIYILHRITTPAVLVECGFLSNPDELSRLSSQDYQTSLAVVLISAAAEFLVE